jgi:hypothetical protein
MIISKKDKNNLVLTKFNKINNNHRTKANLVIRIVLSSTLTNFRLF